MSKFFRPYEGKRPFVFISYSHRNSDEVLEILTQLDRTKLRLWYDEGIPAGSDWPQNIADHMESAAAVIFFRSATALASPNCRTEIEAAAEKKKPLLVLPLDNTAAGPEWQDLLTEADRKSAPLKNTEAFTEAVHSSPIITKDFYRSAFEKVRFDLIGLVFAMLLLLAAAGGLVGVVSGYFDDYLITAAETAETPSHSEATTETADETKEILPSEYEGLFPVEFPDILQDRAYHTALGRKRSENILQSELMNVTALYLCGSLYAESADSIVLTKDGCSVNSTSADTGSVTDLSVIGITTHLDTLYLIRQPIEDLNGLEKLVLLEELHLGGCTQLEDLSSLPKLPSLSLLHLEYGSIRDLSPLSAQPALKTVTVSADMLPLTIPEDARFTVILKP